MAFVSICMAHVMFLIPYIIACAYITLLFLCLMGEEGSSSNMLRGNGLGFFVLELVY